MSAGGNGVSDAGACVRAVVVVGGDGGGGGGGGGPMERPVYSGAYSATSIPGARATGIPEPSATSIPERKVTL